MRLLDTTGRGGGLAGSLGSELLTGGLATSGLTYRIVSDESKGLKCFKDGNRKDIRAVCLVLAIVEAFGLMEFDG